MSLSRILRWVFCVVILGHSAFANPFLDKARAMDHYDFPESIKKDLEELTNSDIFVLRQGEKVEIMMPDRMIFDGNSTHFNKKSGILMTHLRNVIEQMEPKSMMIYGFYVLNPALKVDQRGVMRARLDEINDFLWQNHLGGASIITQAHQIHSNMMMPFWKEEMGEGNIIVLNFISYT